MFVKLKTMTSIKWVNCLVVMIVIYPTFIPTARGLSTVDERAPRKLFGGYRITPKFCRPSKTLPESDPRSNGPTICMFNHECAQRQGEVVGACMDGFLFGACCQIPEEINSNSILHMGTQSPSQIPSNLAAALSYETYGSQASSNEINYQQIPNKNNNPYAPVSNQNNYANGNYYDSTSSELENDPQQNIYNSDTNKISDEHNPDQFYVQNDSVVISSPATNQFDNNKISPYYPSSTQTTTMMTSTTTKVDPYLPPKVSYSPELPTLLTTGNFASNYDDEQAVIQTTHVNPSDRYDDMATNLIRQPLPMDSDYNTEFTHSDITHPSADSVLIEDDLQFSTGYGPSTVYVPAPNKELISKISDMYSTTTTKTTEKPTYKKPAFKPKPTFSTFDSKIQGTDEKYVLVQTLSNQKPQKQGGMTTNDIESIESIILMLNDTKHGPTYNSQTSSSTQSSQSEYISSHGTRKPTLSTNSFNYDKYGSNGFYITSTKPSTLNNKKPTITRRPSITTLSNNYVSLSANSQTISTTLLSPTVTGSTKIPPYKQTTSPSSSTFQPSTNKPVTRPATKKRKPSPQSPYLNENEIIITPTRSPSTKRPFKTPKPPSTSYVTGHSTARPTSTISYSGSVAIESQKYEDPVSSTESGVMLSSYGQNYESSSTENSDLEKIDESPSNVNLPGTQRPSPTVIITPKPTVNMISSSTWTQFTTPIPTKVPSTSYIYNSIVTQRPNDFPSNTDDYINLPPMISNDFDDPGYYGNVQTDRPGYDQVTTEALYTLATNDDGPSYPGFYGPTPTYPTYKIPPVTSFYGTEDEEIYTSPNDLVNFPPVRNPNLNMSATSSSVTSDFELSTPAFVEDEVLKDKMSILVSKIVASLQDNFEALSDMVDEKNATSGTQNDVVNKITTTIRPQSTKRPPTKVPAPTSRPTTQKITTRKPSPIKPASRPTSTRKPSITTRRPTPSTRKPTVATTKKTTAKPLTRRPTTKPTRKVITTTTTTVVQDEIIEDEDENIEEEVGGEQEEHQTEGKPYQCGIRPHVKSGRIVGGKGATFGEWPWQVLVRESTWLGLFTKNKCGGVLITNKFVVTAAHCQPGFLASLVAVFGEFDISGDLEAKRSITKNVKRVIVHRQYDAATFENDLALLELESAIHYDSHIVPICMPSDIAEFTGRMATVTGWGRLKYGGGVPSVLQEVQVPIIENSVCQEMFHTAGHNKKILASFLCAGYANGQKDSCEGDSGGPLVLQRDDGRWELAGTVSHGIKCAAPYLPGVYMRTTYYKPWLKSITGVK